MSMTNEIPTINIAPTVATLINRWKIVGLCTLLGGSAGYGYVYVQQPVYRAQAVILLPLTPPPGSSMTSVSSSGSLFTKSASPLDVINGILVSRRVTQPICEKVGLNQTAVESAFKTEPVVQTNQIIVHADDKNSQRALTMVQEAINVLQLTNRDVNVSMAARQANTIKEALEQQESLIDQLDQKVIAYQATTKSMPDASKPYSTGASSQRVEELTFKYGEITAKIDQAKKAALASNSAFTIPTSVTRTEKWKSEIESAELEWRSAERELGPENPKLAMLKRKYETTVDEFKKAVQTASHEVNTGSDPTIASLIAEQAATKWSLERATTLAKAAPSEAVGLQRLLNQLDVATKVYGQIRQRFEDARIASEIDDAKWSCQSTNKQERRPFSEVLLAFFVDCPSDREGSLGK